MRTLRRVTLRLIGLGVLLFLVSAVALCIVGRKEILFQADAAVVLGNKVYPGGKPSARLAARLDRAVKLYRDGLCPTIIVSGGVDRKGVDEADGMRAYLLAHGIPASAVVADPSGVNTAATARFTADWLAKRGGGSVIAVSQYFHLPRTRLALHQAGVARVGSASADYMERRDLYSIPRELAALVVYYFR